MQEINQGIADVNTGRLMSLEDAKKKLLWHIKSLLPTVLFLILKALNLLLLWIIKK
jgi:hypothetical protein